MFDELRSRRARFIGQLAHLSQTEKQDAFANEAIETGGSMIPPNTNNRSSHLFEISLHGATGYGATEDEAMRNWLRAANAIEQPCLELG